MAIAIPKTITPAVTDEYTTVGNNTLGFTCVNLGAVQSYISNDSANSSNIQYTKSNGWYGRYLVSGSPSLPYTYCTIRNPANTIYGGVLVSSNSQSSSPYVSMQNAQGDGLGIVEMYSDSGNGVKMSIFSTTGNFT